jgi:large subunit ribosomal protein L25
MANEFKLNIFKRDDLTKQGIKKVRRENNIPGVFYSYDSKESIAFYVSQHMIIEAKKSGARIFNILVGDKKQTVIFKSVQYHPVTDDILHIDLYGVNMKETVSIKVQLILIGNPVGVANDGGLLVQSLNEVEIECLPSDIPENFEVDITELGLGDSYRASDLKLEDKYKLATDENQTIASITQAMKEEETQPDLEQGATEGMEPDDSTDTEDNADSPSTESKEDE